MPRGENFLRKAGLRCLDKSDRAKRTNSRHTRNVTVSSPPPATSKNIASSPQDSKPSAAVSTADAAAGKEAPADASEAVDGDESVAISEALAPKPPPAAAAASLSHLDFADGADAVGPRRTAFASGYCSDYVATRNSTDDRGGRGPSSSGGGVRFDAAATTTTTKRKNPPRRNFAREQSYDSEGEALGYTTDHVLGNGAAASIAKSRRRRTRHQRRDAPLGESSSPPVAAAVAGDGYATDGSKANSKSKKAKPKSNDKAAKFAGEDADRRAGARRASAGLFPGTVLGDIAKSCPGVFLGMRVLHRFDNDLYAGTLISYYPPQGGGNFITHPCAPRRRKTNNRINRGSYRAVFDDGEDFNLTPEEVHDGTNLWHDRRREFLNEKAAPATGRGKHLRNLKRRGRRVFAADGGLRAKNKAVSEEAAERELCGHANPTFPSPDPERADAAGLDVEVLAYFLQFEGHQTSLGIERPGRLSTQKDFGWSEEAESEASAAQPEPEVTAAAAPEPRPDLEPVPQPEPAAKNPPRGSDYIDDDDKKIRKRGRPQKKRSALGGSSEAQAACAVAGSKRPKREVAAAVGAGRAQSLCRSREASTEFAAAADDGSSARSRAFGRPQRGKKRDAAIAASAAADDDGSVARSRASERPRRGMKRGAGREAAAAIAALAAEEGETEGPEESTSNAHDHQEAARAPPQGGQRAAPVPPHAHVRAGGGKVRCRNGKHASHSLPATSEEWIAPASDELRAVPPGREYAEAAAAAEPSSGDAPAAESQVRAEPPAHDRVLTFPLGADAAGHQHTLVLFVQKSSIPNAGNGLFAIYEGPARVFRTSGYTDMGRYGPHDGADMKTNIVMDIKAFVYEDTPSEWSFEGPPTRAAELLFEKIMDKNVIIDITADTTGRVHLVARNMLLPFVNEVLQNPPPAKCSKSKGSAARKTAAESKAGAPKQHEQTVDADYHDDGSLHYLLRPNIFFRKGEARELLMYYGPEYDNNRRRKEDAYGSGNNNNSGAGGSQQGPQDVIIRNPPSGGDIGNDDDLSTITDTGSRRPPPTQPQQQQAAGASPCFACGAEPHARGARPTDRTHVSTYFYMRQSISTMTAPDMEAVLDMFVDRTPVDPRARHRMSWVVARMETYVKQYFGHERGGGAPPMTPEVVDQHWDLRMKLRKAELLFPRVDEAEDERVERRSVLLGRRVRKETELNGFMTGVVEELVTPASDDGDAEPQFLVRYHLPIDDEEILSEGELRLSLLSDSICGMLH